MNVRAAAEDGVGHAEAGEIFSGVAYFEVGIELRSRRTTRARHHPDATRVPSSLLSLRLSMRQSLPLGCAISSRLAEIALLVAKAIGNDIHRRPRIGRRRSALRRRNRGHRGRHGWRCRETLQARDDASVQAVPALPLASARYRPAHGHGGRSASRPRRPAATGADTKVVQLPAEDIERADGEIDACQRQLASGPESS